MYEKSSVRRRIGGLILAAGLFSRMGDFKLLMPLRGKTLIENTIDSLLLCGIHSVTVVLGYRGREVERVLRSRYFGGTVTVVYNRDYAVTDMLASVKIGLTAMPACDAFFLLPDGSGHFCAIHPLCAAVSGITSKRRNLHCIPFPTLS